MDFSKIKHRLLIILCVFIILFPFWCIRGLCADDWEPVEYDFVTGIRIIAQGNVFTEGNNVSVGYIPVDNNYIYKIVNTGQSPFPVAESDDIPVLNGTYNFLYSIESGDEYIYRGNTSTYLYLDFRSNLNGSVPLVYKQKVTEMGSTINDLVDNIGLSSMWGIFENSINYIYIVIAIAFGIGLITYLISRLSKGRD